MYEWLDSPAAFEAALASLDAGSRASDDLARVGLDTEFMRVNTFYPELALVQLGRPNEVAWLIDPKPCAPLDALGALLRSPACVKIMHSASEDLVALAPISQAPLAALFDTQIAAAFAGLGAGLGYQKLVALELGIDIEKGETRSDWLRRPLSADQLRYAAIDVLHLPALHDALLGRLDQRNMLDWCQEDCDRLAQGFDADDPQPHLSFTALSKAPVEQQARLRRLLLWRDALARRIDRPRQWIFDNAQATSLIEAPPDQPAALTARLTGARSFPKRELGNLFELLGAPLSDDELLLPPIPAPIRGEAERAFKALRERVNARAIELDLPPGLLASRRVLEAQVRGERPPELDGWRGQVLAEALVQT